MAKDFDRVLVFAGAGASKAVSPPQFPTTREFFERLPEDVTNHPLFVFVLEFLRTQEGLEEIDIEHVLWALQNLRDFYAKITSRKHIEGYTVHRNLIEQLHPRHNTGHLAQLAPQVRNQIDGLVGEIDRRVYDFYGYEPEPSELEENWLDLISRLDGTGSRLDLFTTNYDVVIEAALNRYAGDETSRAYRGIRGVIRQSVDLTNWASGHEWQPILLTKLHGSLDWKYGGSTIFVGDPVFTGDHSKQAIIYPGFKGTNGTAFFDVFHNYLAESIADAKALVFIGFAFRDEHINLIIRENVRPDSKLVVLNPDKTVEFPSRRVQAKYVHEGFGKRAIDRVLKMVGVG